MMKMYAAEVLGKFPVVQHFPFGSIFSWDPVPGSRASPAPTPTPSSTSSTPPASTADGTKAPWSTIPTEPSQGATVLPPTARMRVATPVSSANPSNRIPTISALRGSPSTMAPPPARPTVTPPANITLNPEDKATVPVPGGFAPAIGGVAVTTAPWAKPPTGPSGFGKGSGGGGEASMSPGGATAGSPDSASLADPPVRRVRSGSVNVASTGSLAGGKVTEYTNNQETEKGEEEKDKASE
ncbi:hypothetical protein ABW21_db0207235 [Orbilia brochopaga]|nr:hypothetical protein ABW21_db0207235 [Drechslerella brochopaga]